jgi:hypothetical protein
VVGDHREVVAAQGALGDRQVADGRGERLGRVEALVTRRRSARRARTFLPRAIPRVRRSLARTSIFRPRRFVPVSARIWVRPAAPSRSLDARASSRPADSRKTIASRVSGSIVPSPLAAACSTSARQRAVRFALATTPPGLLA